MLPPSHTALRNACRGRNRMDPVASSTRAEVGGPYRNMPKALTHSGATWGSRESHQPSSV